MPGPSDLLTWQCNDRQYVVLPRADVEWIAAVAAMEQAAVVVWAGAIDGFQIVLWPGLGRYGGGEPSH